MLFWSLLVASLLVVTGVRADYECLCSYRVETEVFEQPDSGSAKLGYMYEFDCRPTTKVANLDAKYTAIVYSKQVGYVVTEPEIRQQICQGNPPFDGILPPTTTTTTLPTTTTTLPSTTTTNPTTTTTLPPTTTTTTMPTTTPTIPTTTPTTPTTTPTTPTTTPTTPTTPTTTPTTPTTPTTTPTTPTTPTTTPTTPTTTPTTPTTPTTTPTTPTTTPTTTTTTRPTTPSTTLKPTTAMPTTYGNINLCPASLRNGQTPRRYIFQHGSSCYEYRDALTDFITAQNDCFKRSGVLFQILSQDEQNYIYNLLKTIQKFDPIWLGIHDVNHEEKFEWVSDAPVSYTNWMPGRLISTYHNQEDCGLFVYARHGQWDDVVCRGYLFTLAQHPWICQYNTTTPMTG